MTEDEARKRWCPFARSRAVDYTAPDGDRTSVSRVIGNVSGPTTGCIADECMAWRTDDASGGYCGLAGKP